MNIAIMQAFVQIREFSLTHKELAQKIMKLEKKYNKQFKDMYEALSLLLHERNWEGRERIGLKKMQK